jgi:hypothetical protein
LDPRNASAYASRSFIYSALGNYQEALADANKALELDTKLAIAYVNRGIAFEKLGNNAGAKADYKKACEFGIKWACEKSSGNVQLNGSQKTEEKGKTSSLRIFQPGDYINYKVTGFVNAGGDDVPVFGTAHYKVLDETQVDYYGNRCKVFRMTTDFTVIEKDRSKRVTRFVDLYFTQDLYGSLMNHGGKDSEKGIPSFVKTPSTGWYFSYKCPLNIHESLSQNVELTDGSSINGTDMVLSEERVSVSAGVFSGVKTISNTLRTNADLSKWHSMETTWIVPEIGILRSNLEYTYDDKRRMKLILEMTDTNIPYKK